MTEYISIPRAVIEKALVIKIRSPRSRGWGVGIFTKMRPALALIPVQTKLFIPKSFAPTSDTVDAHEEI